MGYDDDFLDAGGTLPTSVKVTLMADGKILKTQNVPFTRGTVDVEFLNVGFKTALKDEIHLEGIDLRIQAETVGGVDVDQVAISSQASDTGSIYLYGLDGVPGTADNRVYYELLQQIFTKAGAGVIEDPATICRELVVEAFWYNPAQDNPEDLLPLRLSPAAHPPAIGAIVYREIAKGLSATGAAKPNHLCAEMATTMTYVVQTLGVAANSVVVWGGENSKVYLWKLVSQNNNMVSIQALGTPVHEGSNFVSPGFRYHVLTKVGGTYHDASFDDKITPAGGTLSTWPFIPSNVLGSTLQEGTTPHWFTTVVSNPFTTSYSH